MLYLAGWSGVNCNHPLLPFISVLPLPSMSTNQSISFPCPENDSLLPKYACTIWVPCSGCPSPHHTAHHLACSCMHMYLAPVGLPCRNTRRRKLLRKTLLVAVSPPVLVAAHHVRHCRTRAPTQLNNTHKYREVSRLCSLSSRLVCVSTRDLVPAPYLCLPSLPPSPPTPVPSDSLLPHLPLIGQSAFSTVNRRHPHARSPAHRLVTLLVLFARRPLVLLSPFSSVSPTNNPG